MNFGKTIVEQLDKSGKICMDKDISHSSTELKKILKSFFPIIGEEKGLLVASVNNNKFAIYVKNITYLGIPHPIYKKRVQLGSNFLEKFEYFKKKNIAMLIIGVYNYDNNLLFVDFDTKNYINNKSHNSSAHVLVSDLQEAYNRGITSKIDSRTNKITVFNTKNVNKFLDIKFNDAKDPKLDIFSTLTEFFESINLSWTGIDCYKEMIENDFNQKFQPEWPGFYLEYLLSKYISNSSDVKNIEYKQNKKSNQFDLDLFFPNMPAFGDLKCHTSGVSAIPGNDYETVMKIIEDYSIYYVVCEHETIKDKDMGYKTTKYWNAIQHKENLMSYSSRMKGKVKLKSYMVLEINKYNAKYLSAFQKNFQNSNGKPRNSKISIKKNDFSNFVIYKHSLI